MKKLFSFYVLLLVLASCSSELDEGVEVEHISDREIKIINLNDALSTLSNFMDKNERFMLSTKSGTAREISRVQVIYKNATYSDIILTKSASVDSTSISDPSCYVVNFADSSGYAVLGANTSVPPIVAVTEKGSIDADKIVTADSVDIYELYREKDCDCEDEILLEDFDWYNDEEDDFYVSKVDDTPIDDWIASNIFHTVVLTVSDGRANGNSGDGMDYHVICEPLLQTEWGQGDWNTCCIYNKYCTKKCGNNQKHVHAGCGTAALAAVLAYNEFPDIRQNGLLLDYDAMKSKANPEELDSLSKEYVSLLYKDIFYRLDHAFINKFGTCTMPNKISDALSGYGYSNVCMYKKNYFSDEMFKATSQMLSNSRPVIISGVRRLWNGHTWIIDGADYIKDKTAETVSYMYHCDWGWEGNHNGYFSSDCFDPQGKGKYNWHFRLITYDVVKSQIY